MGSTIRSRDGTDLPLVQRPCHGPSVVLSQFAKAHLALLAKGSLETDVRRVDRGTGALESLSSLSVADGIS